MTNTTQAHAPDVAVRLPSLLDTDLYKLTMQQAVIRHFHDAQVTCACALTDKFTNRARDMRFSAECVAAVRESIARAWQLTRPRLAPAHP